MKKNVALFVSALFLVSSAVMASPKIANMKVHAAKKNGKDVKSCAYCHEGAGIAKKKLGMLKGQPSYAKLGQNKSCAGAGCHK
jgi:cytochrome c553